MGSFAVSQGRIVLYMDLNEFTWPAVVVQAEPVRLTVFKLDKTVPGVEAVEADPGEAPKPGNWWWPPRL